VLYWDLWWLILFLILLKSLLGIVAFLGVLLVSILLAIAGSTKSTKWKVLLSFLLVYILLPSIFIGTVIKDYYNFEEIEPENVEHYTPLRKSLSS
jgi:hypothetical protein